VAPVDPCVRVDGFWTGATALGIVRGLFASGLCAIGLCEGALRFTSWRNNQIK
jgi:hypothetical protein